MKEGITEKIVLISDEDKAKIFGIIRDLMEVFKDPDDLEKKFPDLKHNYYQYSAVCIVLGEFISLMDDKDSWEKVCYVYMQKLKGGIHQYSSSIKTALFGGLTGAGFGAYSMYKGTSYYKKFIDSLNNLLVAKIDNFINYQTDNIGSSKIDDYDTISGMSGVVSYLVLFKENPNVLGCAIRVLEYLVRLTNDITIIGHKVPGWYISSENHFLKQEQMKFRKGGFNFGLSHGFTGILAALSIALKEGLEVKGQKDAIVKMLNNLKIFKIINEKGDTCWPGQLSFDEYINSNTNVLNIKQASWCYGTPGIARTMYIAGSTVKDTGSIEIAIRTFEKLFETDENLWLLNSPTFCHGYAGLAAIAQAMYKDTGNKCFENGAKKVLKCILKYYDTGRVFNFFELDTESKTKFKDVSNFTLLGGISGILLTLGSFIKFDNTNWMRHFLIN